MRGDETLPDYALTLDLAVREVQASIEELKKAGVAHQAGLADRLVCRLRSGEERERLSRWAAYRREARAARRASAARRRREKGPARVAGLSAWLRRCWKAGGQRL